MDIANNMYDVCENLVEEHKEANNLEAFRLDVLKYLAVDFDIKEEEFQKSSANDLTEKLYKEVRESFSRKTESIARQAFPVIKNVFEQRGDMFKNIVVPFTDGKRAYNVVTNLEKAYKTEGEELIRAYEKSIMLAHIDDAWKEHLREMDDLKQSVQNATYEQKDPLLIYKFESFNLFKVMVDKINKSVVSTLMKGQIPFEAPEEVKQAEEKRTDLSKMQTGRSDAPVGQTNQAPRKTEPVKVGPKVGRNDPCPCGSGKKFKNCHGKEE